MTATDETVPTLTEVPMRRGGLARGLVRTGRPKQWIKNVLVLAAPAAAGVLDDWQSVVRVAIAFVAFSLAASGTYLLNDASDVEADGRHPEKRFRPIAAGVVPVWLARVVGVLLVVAAIALSATVGGWQLPAVVGFYLLNTTAYTLWLKHIPVVDLVAVAAGFVLRALGGAAAVGVPVSNWFFIVASLGSLFMDAGNRESELRNQAGAGTRRTLEVYSHDYLSYVRAMSSGAVIVAYSLWAFERDAASVAAVPLFTLSMVPFVCGILRYAMLVDAGSGEAPEDLVLHDRALKVFGAVLVVLIAVGVYAG
ncbi:MAG: decaprenyl-phosphate phosphoribosyltransferase [Actinomycetota bacterium]|nr:decaprenyl-phosphate phosphoribosyltransferase [Actinomycetota bacterium]